MNVRCCETPSNSLPMQETRETHEHSHRRHTFCNSWEVLRLVALKIPNVWYTLCCIFYIRQCFWIIFKNISLHTESARVEKSPQTPRNLVRLMSLHFVIFKRFSKQQRKHYNYKISPRSPSPSIGPDINYVSSNQDRGSQLPAFCAVIKGHWGHKIYKSYKVVT